MCALDLVGSETLSTQIERIECLRRGRSRVVAVSLALLVIGSIFGGTATIATATQPSVETCQTIDEGGVYTLSQDLQSSAGVCLQIAASNVTIQGNGHAIEGDGDGVAIRTNSSEGTDIILQNVTISDWTVGVHYRTVDGGTIENVTADGNREGIAIHRSQSIHVSNNVVRGNDHQGMRIIETDNSIVSQNIAVENVADGFVLRGATNNTLRVNVARRNGDGAGADGFLVADSSHGTVLRGNAAVNNTDDGIDVQNTSRTTVVANNASFNVGVVNSDGIELSNSDNNVVRNNVANGNVDDGIDLQRVNGTIVSENVANKNVNDGVPIARSHNNIVRDNIANNNSKVDREIVNRMLPGKELEEAGSEGFTLRSGSSNNTLVGNTAHGNHRQGIRLWLGARRNTITNNTATDNGADGIAVHNASGNSLTRNDVRNNENNGIHLNNGATDNELTENHLRGNRLSGILLYTANGSVAAGNVVTGNGAGPNANGIRIGNTEDATLLNNPTYDNEGANVHVISSGSIRILESWGVTVTNSENVTVGHSWLLKEVVPTAKHRTPRGNQAKKVRNLRTIRQHPPSWRSNYAA